MNKANESFLGMNFKVKTFAIRNATVINSITGLSPLFAQHAALVDAFILADTGSVVDNTGATIDKANKRKALETLGLKVGNAVTSYYVINPNPLLQNRADYNTSTWYSTSEEGVVTMATIVRDLATPIATSLTGFGALPTDVAALTTAINTFVNVIANPTTYIDIKKSDNQKLVTIADDIRTLFTNKIDILMRSFQVNNPTLYALYQSARAIDTNGSVIAPTITIDVPGNSVTCIHKAVEYVTDTFYTIQNMNKDTISFSLSTIDGVEGSPEILLASGETCSRLASNLSETGTFFTVKNDNIAPVKVRLWVE